MRAELETDRVREQPNSARGIMRRNVLELIKQHRAAGTIPTSTRFLYYELVAKEIVSKEKNKSQRPDQPVSKALTELRGRGAVLWSEISDETRDVSNYCGGTSIREELLECLEVCCLDYWDGLAPLVLAESRSLRGVLIGLCSRYRVFIGSVNGQCAGYLHNNLTPLFANTPDRPVLYFGDWDFSGGHIEANTRRVIELNIGARVNWKRLALTEGQIDEYNLPVIQKFDNRTRKYHAAVETEALRQEIIVGILEKEFEVLVPIHRQRKMQALEAKERDRLRRWIEAMTNEPRRRPKNS